MHKYVELRLNNIFIGLFLMCAGVGCTSKENTQYIYAPIEGVMFTVEVNKLSYVSESKSVFLRFKLKVNNSSNEKIHFNIAGLQASLNGEKSSATYYDSLASVMPEEEKLISGESHWNLYFVYSEKVRDQGVGNFAFTKFGLRVE